METPSRSRVAITLAAQHLRRLPVCSRQLVLATPFYSQGPRRGTATQSTKTNASPAPTARPPIMTDPGNPPETPSTSSSNKIWIAGVVVGVIALGCLIGLLGFCIARRRLQKRPTLSKDDDMVPVNTPSVDDKDYMYKAYQGAELHNRDRAELHFDQRPVELSHYGSNVVEMPTQHDRHFVAELDGAPVRR
ncbi:hypothetical protein RJZ57_002014 [Blastomyces gilchristii]